MDPAVAQSELASDLHRAAKWGSEDLNILTRQEIPPCFACCCDSGCHNLSMGLYRHDYVHYSVYGTGLT